MALRVLLLLMILLPSLLRGQDQVVTGEEARKLERLAWLHMARQSEELYNHLSAAMQRKWTVEGLHEQRAALLESGGRLLYLQKSRVPKGFDNPELKALEIPIHLERGAVRMVASWRGELGEKSIVSLQFGPFVEPTPTPHALSTLEMRRLDAPYVNRGRFENWTITLHSSGGVEGVLTIPTKADEVNKVPAVLLLSSPSHLDRDGSFGVNRMMEDLAHGLGTRGVAVLRFDRPSFVDDDAVYTLEDEYLALAREALAQLAATKQLDSDCLYIAGVEAGGAVAITLAKDYPKLAGVIAINMLTITGAEEQFRSLKAAGEYQDAVPNLRSRIAEFTMVMQDFLKEELKPDQRIDGFPAEWWYQLRSLRPMNQLAEVKPDVLLLQGQKDYRLMEEDVYLYRQAAGALSHVSFILLPTMNRWMMESRFNGDPREAAIPSHVGVDVIHSMMEFIEWSCQKKRSARRGSVNRVN